MLTINQVQSDFEINAARDLIREFTDWAISQMEGLENAPTFANLEGELATLPGKFAPPSGRLFLALQDGQPAGCVAFVGHDAQTCELKRMYVRPSFRGQGIGKELVKVLLEDARQAGFERMVLDSFTSMKAAHAIYRGFGFQEMTAPEEFPDELKPYVVFMECTLSEKI